MNTPNPYDIRRILFYNGFFALGWYVANTGLSKSRIPWYTTAILFVSLTSYAIYNDPSRQYSLLGIVAAVVGVMFSWGLCQEVKRWQRLAFVLSYIGKQTMAIYVWHVFCFKCFEMVLAQLGVIPQMTVGWHGSFRSTMLGGIAYTLVGVLVPVSFGWVKDKVIIHFQYIQ